VSERRAPLLRIRAVARRHAYTLWRSPHRLFDVTVWPLVDTVLFGSIGIFFARHYSGKRRPGYEQLLADAKAGKLGAVIAWDADRLTRHAKPIDDFVTEAVIAALTGPGLTASIERRRAAGPDLNPAMLAARLAADKRKLAALDLLRDDLADYETRVASVEARMAEARGALAASATSATLAGLPGTQAALERAWSGWGTDRRRDVIAAVVERVIVQPVGRGARFDGTKHLDIRWKA